MTRLAGCGAGARLAGHLPDEGLNRLLQPGDHRQHPVHLEAPAVARPSQGGRTDPDGSGDLLPREPPGDALPIEGHVEGLGVEASPARPQCIPDPPPPFSFRSKKSTVAA